MYISNLMLNKFQMHNSFIFNNFSLAKKTVVLFFLLSFNLFSQKNITRVFKNNSTEELVNGRDTTYIDICLGDSLLLTMDQVQLESDFNAKIKTKYPTTQFSGINFIWNITGKGFDVNDSVYFKPKESNGYYIDLNISYKLKRKNSDTILDVDAFLEYKLGLIKVRVSALPNYNSLVNIPSKICMDDPIYIQLPPNDGSKVDDPIHLKKGVFKVGGLYLAEIKLPDGTGGIFKSPVEIDDYGNKTVIKSVKDIDMVCITMEHSFLGDLEMTLKCPTGNQAVIFNAFKQNGGMIPGGFYNEKYAFPGKVAVSIGNDLDIDNGKQGYPRWQYCFSSTKNTLGTFGDEYLLGNTKKNLIGADALNPDGIYTPEQSFAEFIGCPVKGKWTLSIKDNQEDDDGYIFDWGVYFNPDAFPIIESYQNKITEQGWNKSFNYNAIKTLVGDTNYIIRPRKLGERNDYKYELKTDYGCKFDTLIKVNTELCLVIPNVVVTSSKVGNDKFFIYTGDVKEFSCTIYNRWGNVMSQMNDLHTAWDCKSSNGQVVDEGTYMYAVRILYNNGTEAKRTGYFEVKH